MQYLVWIGLVVLRVVLCLWPMNGYIHPDEFIQNTEPLAGDIFGLDVKRTWEFNSSMPVRSVFFPHITSGLAFEVLKYLDIVGVIPVSPYTLLVLPRVMMALTSLLCIDYPVYTICRLLGLNAANALTILASSYVTLVYHTRTFSNSYETMTFTLLLLLVVDSRLDQFRPLPGIQPATNPKKVNPTAPRPNHAFWIGVFITEGTFNRLTFPCYFLVPLVFWLTGSASTLQLPAAWRIAKNLLSLLPGCLTMLISNLVIDSIYYGSLDPAALANPHLLYSNLNWDFLQKNISVTPLNSLLYNLDVNNLAQHGLHPRITHILVNLPMLFFPLVVCFATEIFSVVGGMHQTESTGFTASSSRSFFALCFMTPVFLLSMVPHQEPRFILPVLVPLVLLYAEFVMSGTTLPNAPWIIWNLLGCLMFGFIHQGGVVPAVSYTHSLASSTIQNTPTHFHYVFYHTYMPPHHLGLQSSMESTTIEPLRNTVTFHDLMGGNSFSLSSTVEMLLSDERTLVPKSHHKEVYVFAPASLDSIFCRLSVKQNYKLVRSFFPHVSTEDLPEVMPAYNCVAEPTRSYENKSTLQTWQAVFSLNMYKAERVQLHT